MTVRLNDTLSEFVATSVGKSGSYENVSEYTRDLIRRDKQRVEHEVFERLEAELAQAYSAPDSADRPLTASEVIARKLSCSRLLFVARFASRKQPGDSWTRSTTTPPGVGGEAQAERHITGLFDAFNQIEAHGVPYRPAPAEFGVRGFFFRHEDHLVYWRYLSNGDIGIVTMPA